MKVLGLTGPSGSGKGFLKKTFEKHRIAYLDTDAVYHGLVDKPSLCTEELEEAFGSFILCSDGSLNRKKLAAFVFSGDEKEKERLAVLNEITHRHVLRAARTWLSEKQAKGYKAAAIDAPLLYESSFDKECDFVIVVLASASLRLSRIMARDGLNEQQAKARMHAQPSDDFYKARADYIIYNNADEASAVSALESILASSGLL